MSPAGAEDMSLEAYCPMGNLSAIGAGLFKLKHTILRLTAATFDCSTAPRENFVSQLLQTAQPVQPHIIRW